MFCRKAMLPFGSHQAPLYRGSRQNRVKSPKNATNDTVNNNYSMDCMDTVFHYHHVGFNSPQSYFRGKKVSERYKGQRAPERCKFQTSPFRPSVERKPCSDPDTYWHLLTLFERELHGAELRRVFEGIWGLHQHLPNQETATTHMGGSTKDRSTSASPSLVFPRRAPARAST